MRYTRCTWIRPSNVAIIAQNIHSWQKLISNWGKPKSLRDNTGKHKPVSYSSHHPPTTVYVTVALCHQVLYFLLDERIIPHVCGYLGRAAGGCEQRPELLNGDLCVAHRERLCLELPNKDSCSVLMRNLCECQLIFFPLVALERMNPEKQPK